MLAHQAVGDLPIGVQWYRCLLIVVIGAQAVGLRAAIFHLKPLDRGSYKLAATDGFRLEIGVARMVVFAMYVAAIVAGFAYQTVPSQHLLSISVLAMCWLVVPMISVLVGDIWLNVTPSRALANFGQTLAKHSKRGRRASFTEPGAWPATLGLGAVAGFDQILPNGRAASSLLWLVLAHLASMVLLGFFVGNQAATRLCPIVAITSLFAAAAPIHAADGSIQARVPFSGLASLPVRPGTWTVPLVIVGIVTFDATSGQDPLAPQTTDGQLATVLAKVVLLGGTVALLALSYLGIVWLVSGRRIDSTRQLVGRTTPALVPVAIAALVAHHLSIAPPATQAFLDRLVDPLNRGWSIQAASATTSFWSFPGPIDGWLPILTIAACASASIRLAEGAVRAHTASGDQLAMPTLLALYFIVVYLGVTWLLPT